MFGWKARMQKQGAKVLPLRENESGLLFCVQKGKGLLRERYVYGEPQSLHTLLWDDAPLVNFLGDEYYCPTCQKLVAAGWGLDKAAGALLKELSDRVNAPFVSLRASFAALLPLLGLLEDGYYLLSDEQLAPTDGEGGFFWAGATNRPRRSAASCPYYDASGGWDAPLWDEDEPAYLLPTQSPALFDRQRIEFYRDKPECRTIAYAMDGYLCAVLDGHHKAAAAALAGRLVNTLVIQPAHWVQQKGGKKYLCVAGMELAETKLPSPFVNYFESRKAGPADMRRWLAHKNPAFDGACWDNDLLAAAKAYPTVEQRAAIRWAGDVSDARLNGLLRGQETLHEKQLLRMVEALYALRHPRFAEVAMAFGKKEGYARVWHAIYSMLAKRKPPGLEDFFVEYLVNDEGLRPDVTALVDTFLAGEDTAGGVPGQ